MITPDSPTLAIFLHKIAVSYVFTVTPTAVQDKYIITLEPTFEVDVPQPVVTVEPNSVDFDALETVRVCVCDLFNEILICIIVILF